jgi:hypothetical protein
LTSGYSGVKLSDVVLKSRLIAMVALLASCQNRPPAEDRAYKPPTATEVFHLRSECVRLGEKIVEENLIGSAQWMTQEFHYNPKTNRCYVRLTDTDKIKPRENYGINLYDGQTREMLAFAQVKHGEKVGMVSGTTMRDTTEADAGFAEAMEFINKAMENDRK